MTDRSQDVCILLKTAGSILNGGRAYTIPIPVRGTDMASTYLALGSWNGDSCSRRSQANQSMVSPTWWTPDPAAADGSTTLSAGSVPHATEHWLGCCEIRKSTLEPRWYSSGHNISGGKSQAWSTWTIASRLPSECTQWPGRCHTSDTPHGVGGIDRSPRLRRGQLPTLAHWCGIGAGPSTKTRGESPHQAVHPIHDMRCLCRVSTPTPAYSVERPGVQPGTPTKPPDRVLRGWPEPSPTRAPPPGTKPLWPTTEWGGGASWPLAPELP